MPRARPASPLVHIALALACTALSCVGCLPFGRDLATPVAVTARRAATAVPRATQTPTPLAQKASPTGRPTDVASAHAPSATPRATLRTYFEPTLGFSFQYAPSWSLSQAVGADMSAQGGPHYADSITLQRGDLVVSIAYRTKAQSRALDTSMPAGALVGRGAIRFLGSTLPRTALVLEGKDKAVYYIAERALSASGDALVVHAAFTSASANYPAVALSPEAQAEVDAILESFSLPVAPPAVGLAAEGWMGQAEAAAGEGATRLLLARDGLDPLRYLVRADDAALLMQWSALAESDARLRVWGRVEADATAPGGTVLRLARWELVAATAASLATGQPETIEGYLERAPLGAAWLISAAGEHIELVIPSAALERTVTDAAWSGVTVRLTGRRAATAAPFIVQAVEATSAPAPGEVRDLAAFATPSASSQLPSDRLGSYTPWDALDGQPATAWAEGAAGAGQGEWLALTLPGPAALESVEIQAGYAASTALFAANNRPRTVHVMLDDGTPMQFALVDTAEPQTLALDGVMATSVRIFLGQSYPGTRFDDTCLSEVHLLGRPVLSAP